MQPLWTKESDEKANKWHEEPKAGKLEIGRRYQNEKSKWPIY